MLLRLSDVIGNRASLVSQLEKRGNTDCANTDKMKLFDSARMDGVVVLDDLIAKRYLEYIYTYNTHIAPHCLPGMGMTIGDIINHEGFEYLTLSLGVMITNATVLHAVREHESLYTEWTQKREEMNRRVQAFTEEVCTLKAGCFGIKDFAGFNQLKSFVGWRDAGTPAPEFIQLLRDFSAMMVRRRKRGMWVLYRAAYNLIQDLEPFSIFKDFLWSLRKDYGHKGFPQIHDGMLQINTPAASGGATMHSYPPEDDFGTALPSANDLLIVAVQAGNTVVVAHLGEGNKPGEHYFMLPPRNPFFPKVQERVDGDQGLNDLWEQVARFDGGKEAIQERSDKWMLATIDIKGQVIKEVVPQLISERVLGWHVNMVQEKGVALLRPIVAESHYDGEKEVVEANGLSVIRPAFKSLLVDAGRSYNDFKSVFVPPKPSDQPSEVATG